jgi:hypothetical protein
MIIEQQQILTTQNLAALFLALGLTDTLRGQLIEMAKRCFIWICKRQQIKIRKGHARLIMVKNTAYAWRQMIFFLSLTSDGDSREFLSWAEETPTQSVGRVPAAVSAGDNRAQACRRRWLGGGRFSNWCPTIPRLVERTPRVAGRTRAMSRRLPEVRAPSRRLPSRSSGARLEPAAGLRTSVWLNSQMAVRCGR